MSASYVHIFGLASLNFDSSVVVSVMIPVLVSAAESAVEWLLSGLSSISISISDTEQKYYLLNHTVFSSLVDANGQYYANRGNQSNTFNIAFDSIWSNS